VSIDEQHIALPKLYGAPAYARPPRVVAESERPFDPDELPIEAYRSLEDEAYLDLLPGRTYTTGSDGSEGRDGDASRLQPRVFRLRSIAGRIFGDD
jgi:hypothetical protein